MNKRIIAATLAVAVSLFTSLPAMAATPTFSISWSGDSAQLTVTGDANSNATLFYNVGSSTGFKTYVLGTTNGSGNLTTTVSISSLGLNTGESLYIVVNGQQSSVRAWPAVSNSGTTVTAPVLSQNSVTLGPNQSTMLTLQGATNSAYVLSNTNPAVATAQIGGSQINVVGSQVGATTMTLCYNGTTSPCATLTVNVQSGSGATGAITFDNANPNIAVGGNLTVTILGAASYFVKTNSNPTIMTYTLNGSAMNITGSASGNAILSVCSAIDTNTCGQLSVTVGGGSSSSNTNAATTNQGVNFSVGSANVVVGQTTTVQMTGGTTFFVSVNTNPIAAVTSSSGNTLYITGAAAGTTSLTVCAAGGSLCGTLPVTVTTTATANTATTPAAPVVATTPAATTPAPVVNSGNSSAVLATTIQLMQAQLQQMLLAIQTMQSQLSQLLSTVSVSTSGGSAVSSAPAAAFTGKFVSFLSLNSTGPEVTALQKKLAADGYYSGPITGTFGPLTASAVKKFQEANGLDPAGYVGPGTRAMLNQ